MTIELIKSILSIIIPLLFLLLNIYNISILSAIFLTKPIIFFFFENIIFIYIIPSLFKIFL